MLKPKSLVIVAWLWIAFAGAWGLVAIPSLLRAWAAPDQCDLPNTVPSEITFMMTHAWFIVMAMAIGCAAAGVLCGVALLQLQEWGRKGLVALTYILFALFFGLPLKSYGFLELAEHGTTTFYFAVVLGVGLFFLPAMAMLKFLQGAEIRKATRLGSQF